MPHLRAAQALASARAPLSPRRVRRPVIRGNTGKIMSTSNAARSGPGGAGGGVLNAPVLCGKRLVKGDSRGAKEDGGPSSSLYIITPPPLFFSLEKYCMYGVGQRGLHATRHTNAHTHTYRLYPRMASVPSVDVRTCGPQELFFLSHTRTPPETLAVPRTTKLSPALSLSNQCTQAPV